MWVRGGERPRSIRLSLHIILISKNPYRSYILFPTVPSWQDWSNYINNIEPNARTLTKHAIEKIHCFDFHIGIKNLNIWKVCHQTKTKPSILKFCWPAFSLQIIFFFFISGKSSLNVYNIVSPIVSKHYWIWSSIFLTLRLKHLMKSEIFNIVTTNRLFLMHNKWPFEVNPNSINIRDQCKRLFFVRIRNKLPIIICS